MRTIQNHLELPLPSHYTPDHVSAVWRVPYEARANDAVAWAREHKIQPASLDDFQIHLIAVDVQNTFCIPDFELFVAGRSGRGAVEDNQRLSEFIYRNLAYLTRITATLDTHQAVQIFHAQFLIDREGRHPAPYTNITREEIESGRWSFNPAVAESLGIDAGYGERLLVHYASQLERTDKYALTIWPYHAMLGGIGHALVAAVEEAIFFHTIARGSQPDFVIKGKNPFTEHYSALGPEVLLGPDGEPIGTKDTSFIDFTRQADAIIIAGQAKSHCVAWTISDLLADIEKMDSNLAQKVYLLVDCTSPVVVPGADFTTQADAAFERFSAAGMHRVRSTDPLASWPGMS